MSGRPDRAPLNVIFDLGGVLIDWNPRYLFRDLFAGDDTAMEAFLSGVCSPAWNERQDAGRPIAEAEAELIGRFPGHERLIRAYYAGFDRMLGGAIEGTVAVLEELAAAEVPLYALTNWSAETFPHAMRRFAFLGTFRDIVVSGRIGLVKPDRRIFDHLFAKTKIDAAASVFIDDSPKNVAGAVAAGLPAIQFRSPGELRAALAGLGLPVAAV